MPTRVLGCRIGPISKALLGAAMEAVRISRFSSNPARGSGSKPYSERSQARLLGRMPACLTLEVLPFLLSSDVSGVFLMSLSKALDSSVSGEVNVSVHASSYPVPPKHSCTATTAASKARPMPALVDVPTQTACRDPLDGWLAGGMLGRSSIGPRKSSCTPTAGKGNQIKLLS